MTRILRAIEALRGSAPRSNPVIASTVRPSESHGYGANKRTTYAQFIQLAMKWTAIAVDRNGNAVASTPVRVMRRAKGGKYEGGWRTARVGPLRKSIIRPMLDCIATKALSDSEELEEITDHNHPLVRLLANPNPWQSGFDLIYDMVAFLDLTGNAYAAHVPGPQSPVYELWSLPPQWTRPVPDPEKFISGYVYGRGQEIETNFSPEDVTHVKYANPSDPYLGRGCVAGYVGDAQLSLAFTDINLAMLDNGAAPSLIFKAPNATPSQRAEIEEKIRQRWTGVRNAFSAIVTGGDIEVVPNAARGFTDMAFMLSDDKVADLIANSHGMSPALLRMDSAALATAQAAMPHWQAMAIKPRCKRIAEAFNRTFVAKFREALGDDSLCVVFDDPVTKDYAALVQQQVQLRSASPRPIVSLNEARGALGLDAVEGGDDVEDAPAPPSLDPFGDPNADPNADPEKPGDVKNDKEDPADDAGEKVKAVRRRKTMADLWFDRTECHHERRPRTKKISEERKVELTALQLALLFSAYFDGAADQIVAGVTLSGLSSVELARMAEYNARSMRATRPVFESLYVNGYNFGVGEVNSRGTAVLEPIAMPKPSGSGSGGSGGGAKPATAPPDPQAGPGIEVGIGQPVMAMNQRAASLLDGYQRNLYQTIGTTVDNRVRTALANGLLEGEGIDQLKARVQNLFTDMKDYAAERIARTESARAYGMARHQAWKESGIVVATQWLLSGDPCEACVDLYERRPVVRLGQPFARVGESFGGLTVGFGDVYHDPLHPNCRCGTGAIFDDDPEAEALKTP